MDAPEKKELKPARLLTSDETLRHDLELPLLRLPSDFYDKDEHTSEASQGEREGISTLMAMIAFTFDPEMKADLIIAAMGKITGLLIKAGVYDKVKPALDVLDAHGKKAVFFAAPHPDTGRADYRANILNGEIETALYVILAKFNLSASTAVEYKELFIPTVPPTARKNTEEGDLI